MPQSRAEKRLNGKKGAHLSWANTEDPTARTEPARDAMRRKFELQADPDGTLSESERIRRADQLRRAWLADLAAKSARARRERMEAKGSATKNVVNIVPSKIDVAKAGADVVPTS